MTAHDTLRWGDVESFRMRSGENLNVTSKQLLQAHWRWPLTWTVQFIALPSIDLVNETSTFTLTFRVTVGVGQAQITYPLVYTFAPPTFAQVVDQKFIPAQDLQIIATLTGTVAALVKEESMVVATFAAPMTEPHAMTHLLDHHEGAADRLQKAEHWMPPGFNEERLAYRR